MDATQGSQPGDLGTEVPQLPGFRRNPQQKRAKTAKLQSTHVGPHVMSDEDKEAQRFRNTREPFSFMQHHGKPIERPFVRSGKKMQATFGRGAKGTSIAQRAGMSLMQDPRNPSVEVARGAGVTKTRDPEHFRTSHGTDFGTRDVRMHHPAAVAAEMAEDAADSEERESKADQPVFTAFGDRRGGPKSHYYSLRRQNEDRSDLRQLSGTAYTKKLLATAMPFKDVQSMPAHLRNDLYGHHGQVLCFDAFFKEEVPESAREAYRVRKCRIQYYLDDDTLAIVEPEVRNSGLPQGNFLKRTPVPKAGAAGKLGERLTLNDLNVGRSVTIFGRVYHIVDADRKTREALTERGVEVPHGEEMPEDEFEATLAPEQRMWGKDRYVGVKKTSMKVYMEALRGKEVAATVKRAQFLKHNRRVLSFDAVWDDRASLYGGIYRYVVQYFLEDDTVEIREVHEGNDGREPFPMLLSRQKLPRNYEDEVSKVHGTRYEGLEAAPPGHYITHDDLRVGHTIPVYGRPLLLVNCDPATANWLREQGEEVPEPIEVQEDEHELPKDEAAPYKGGVATFGSAEDSLASTKSLVPQKPKKDLKKLLDNDRKILRYRAHLDTPVPQNAERTFVLSLYLADDSIAVYEPPLRNSGIDGGMFVKRQCLRKANGELYQPSDFEPGNTVVILNYRFIVDEADRYTSELLQGRQMGLGADLHLLLTRLWERARFSKYVRKEMFFKLDEDRNGFITVEELREYLSRTSPQPLNNAEAVALIRCMDRDGDGRVDYDEWCNWLNSDPRDWEISKRQGDGPSDEFYLRRRETNDEKTRVQKTFKQFARTFTHRRSQLRSIFHKFDRTESRIMDEQTFRNALSLATDLHDNFLTEEQLESMIRYLFPDDVGTMDYEAFFDMLWMIDETFVNI